MTAFKPGDRVIVTIDGHDIPAEFMHSNDDGMSDLYFGPGVGWGQFGSECVRPVPMDEPTKFGAMVEDDFGLLVRIYDPSYRALGDSAWIRQNVSFQTYRWSELKNPRPYTGGDE